MVASQQWILSVPINDNDDQMTNRETEDNKYEEEARIRRREGRRTTQSIF